MKDNWFIEIPELRKKYLSLSEEDKAQTRKAAIEMQKQLIFSEPWHLDGFSEKDKKIDKQIVETETKKYDLVKKLYKIDESGDIDELLVTKRNLNTEKQELETTPGVALEAR